MKHKTSYEKNELRPDARKRGRPTSYKPAFARQAQILCEYGATDRELADFFQVSPPAIWRWASQFQDFRSAVKTGKDAADDRVERSLFHRAIGYEHDAVKIFPPKTAKGKPLIVPFREHFPPDTTACIFWLKNRRRQQWREVHRIEHVEGELDQLTDEEVMQEVRRRAREMEIPLMIESKK